MILSRLIHFLRSWQRYNRSVRELSLLDDRGLADLGIVRSEIPRSPGKLPKGHNFRLAGSLKTPASAGVFVFARTQSKAYRERWRANRFMS
jgi:uncharacterized protein YjiS (DUF1127 family)